LLVMARNIRVASLVLVFLIAGAATASAADHLNEFTADLSGENHLDDSGDPDGTGEASVVINSDTSEVCFTITFAGIENPVAAHIHQGASDVNGDIVVDFDWPNRGRMAEDGRGSGIGDGCVAGDAAVVAAIVADPSGYYFNVHTPVFAAGAIRGQLEAETAAAAELPATGANLTLFLLLASAAFTVGGAIVYVNRHGHTTH